MVKSTMGTQVLDEADLIDIVKQHFLRYGQGFKQLKITVDLAQRDQPRVGMEIGLTRLNAVLPDDEVERLYYELLESCKDVTQVEDRVMGRVYEMVSSGEISKKVFLSLIKKIKGR